MTQPIRIAQYGVSHAHASGHAAVLQANPDVDFVGVYEPSAANRERVSGRPPYTDVRWFASADAMLSDDSITAIAVEGAVHESLAFARDAIDAGKHVWLDKPAGDDLPTVRAIIDDARERGLMVQLGYMFRYSDAFRKVLDLAASGSLGDVFTVRGRMSTHCSPEVRAQLARHEGGILFELLCHLLDIVVAMLGKPKRVTSFLRNDLGITPGFADNTLAVFEYDRAMAMLESSAMEVEPFACRRFEVCGTRGSAIIEPLEPAQLRVCLDADRDGMKKGWQVVPVENKPRYVDDVVAFVAAIRGEQPPDRTLDHELLVQETLLRASRGGDAD